MSAMLLLLALNAGPSPEPPPPKETRAKLLERVAALPGRAVAGKGTTAERLALLYKEALGRVPTADEGLQALKFIEKERGGVKAYQDFTWAVANSKEFMARHKFAGPLDAIKFGEELQALWAKGK